MIDRSRYTHRCSICSINWPYTTAFAKCPVCSEECRGLKLDDPWNVDDEILTPEQARQELNRRGIPTWGAGRPPSATAIQRSPTKQELSDLEDALEAWAEEAPPWAR